VSVLTFYTFALHTPDSRRWNGEPVAALVERNGRFWLEDLPLTDGNHDLLVTATDAANKSATNNILVSKSAVELAVDEIPVITNGTPVINLSGTINSNDHAVWVNGRRADPTNGVWSVQDVP
jgi:hypothetical protein